MGASPLEINRFFIFGARLPVRRVLEYYILRRLTEEPAGKYGYELKEELIKLFQSAWIPSHKPLYETLHEAEEEGKLKSHWIGSEFTKEARIYQITDIGIESLQTKSAELISEMDEALKCLEMTTKLLYPTVTAEHKAVSPRHSPPLNTSIFVELMILHALDATQSWMVSSQIQEWFRDKFRDTYDIADSQASARLLHLHVRGLITAEELPSVDVNTPHKNRAQKKYHITTNGHAMLRRMSTPEMGFYSRIQAIYEGLDAIRQALVRYRNRKSIVLQLKKH